MSRHFYCHFNFNSSIYVWKNLVKNWLKNKVKKSKKSLEINNQITITLHATLLKEVVLGVDEADT